MTATSHSPVEVESMENLRQRARSWIQANLRHVGPVSIKTRATFSDEQNVADIEHSREVQRKLFDGGFAGLAVPTEYGGQGLTLEHHRVFNHELAGYEYPKRLQAPTMVPCAALILDCGTEEQKCRHIPAILRGEEAWVQMLSEPSGGSDLAGALTTALRDGDEWILNGSKVWTSGAWWSDWALCLARTNWDVPKHRGLTVFMLPVHQPGIEVHRTEMLNGNSEFCQEYLTDVRVPDSDRIGDVDDGWTIAIRWLFHERMLYNSPLTTIPDGTPMGGSGATSIGGLARIAGTLDDPCVRALVGEARMLEVANQELDRRLSAGIASGAIADQAAAIGRAFRGYVTARTATISFDIAGGDGIAWAEDDGELAELGTEFLMRQSNSIGGGTTEMARNVISERVLGMPRELALDREVPFRDAPRGAKGLGAR